MPQTLLLRATLVLAFGLAASNPLAADVGPGGESGGESVLTGRDCEPSLSLNPSDRLSRLRAEEAAMWRRVQDIHGDPLPWTGTESIGAARRVVEARRRMIRRRMGEVSDAFDSILDATAAEREAMERAAADMSPFGSGPTAEVASRRAAAAAAARGAARVAGPVGQGAVVVGEGTVTATQQWYHVMNIREARRRIADNREYASALVDIQVALAEEWRAETENLRILDADIERHRQIDREIQVLQQIEGRAARHAALDRVGDPETPGLLRRGWMQIEPVNPDDARAIEQRRRGVWPCE